MQKLDCSLRHYLYVVKETPSISHLFYHFSFNIDKSSYKMRHLYFGFPQSYRGPSPRPHSPTYRADTSKHKHDLIYILTLCETLWSNEQYQKSLVQLRKAITILDFIISNESIEGLKTSYIEKQKELKERLAFRETHKEEVPIEVMGGQGHGKYKKEQYKHQKDILKGQLSDAIITQKPNVKWEDVCGLQNAKNSLKEAIILPIRFKEIFTGSRKPWKGILLYGPPGTGKTYLAKACATEAESTFFSVSSSDLLSKYVGESQKLIRSLFTMAREQKPSIIFIDQIDSMCGNRSQGQNEASRRVKTEFFVQMQGLGHDDEGVLILGATNLPWALDPAIRRRFERRIYIPLPDYEARLGMVRHGLKNTDHTLTEQQIKDLTTRTENYSGSDINILIRDAVYEPVRRLQLAKQFKKLENGKWMPCRENEHGEPKTWLDFKNYDLVDIGAISMQDIQKAMLRTKPSVDLKQLKKYEEWTKSFGQQG